MRVVTTDAQVTRAIVVHSNGLAMVMLNVEPDVSKI
jgi:hypothetical protein